MSKQNLGLLSDSPKRLRTNNFASVETMGCSG